LYLLDIYGLILVNYEPNRRSASDFAILRCNCRHFQIEESSILIRSPFNSYTIRQIPRIFL